MSTKSPIPLQRIAYTLEQFHQVGGPGRVTSYSLARAGKLRLVKRGRRTVILADEVDRYFNALAPLVLLP
jgi:hypothetical protein